MLPDELQERVETLLGEVLLRIEPVTGGCIGNTGRLFTNDDSYFAKWGPSHISRTFPAEKRGLEELRSSARLIRIPQLIGMCESADGTGILVMEWIHSRPMTSSTWSSLGRGLAELHRCNMAQFGFEADNYIGSTVQENNIDESWPAFFRQRRLLFQADLARANNLWPSSWNSGFDRLCNHLDGLLPGNPEASLVHGDLWAGNVLADSGGNPVLVDPAIYYAHREVDLAMSSLFGSFPSDFYRTYEEEWPLEEGYHSRKEIYNLFHLINHLNLFGESYASSVEAVLKKF